MSLATSIQRLRLEWRSVKFKVRVKLGLSPSRRNRQPADYAWAPPWRAK